MRCLQLFLFASLLSSQLARKTWERRSYGFPLNQEQPSVIKLGIHGITTIEFPMKSRLLDGYGFSLNPRADGQDLFQISFQ